MDLEAKKAPFAGEFIGYTLLLVFALLMLAFPAVAVFMGWRSIVMVQAWRDAQRWVQTPATIEHLQLRVNRDGEATTYRVECRYSYVFNGQVFQGRRVGLADGSDNIGSWQQATYERLKQHFQAIESDPVPCWVNPDNPAEAVLDRQMRWELLLFNLLFVAVFGGISLAVAVPAVWWRRRAARLRSLQARYPDQPWRWKAEWAEGRLQPAGPGWALWLVAVFWNVVSLPVARIPFMHELREERPWTLALLGFPLVGIGLLAGAIVRSRRYRRFSGSRLDLQTFPAVVGGSLRGTLHLVGDLAGIGDVELALRCVRTFVTRHGGESKTSRDVLWEARRSVPTGGTTFGLTELQLPVDFSIPAGCRPTDDTDPADAVRWQLTAKAKLPGADLDLKFDVPVFRNTDGRLNTAVGQQPPG